MIGAAVLHYRRGAATADTVRALLPQVDHLVVVDNHSDDGSLEDLRAVLPDVELVIRDENGGYAAGMREASLRLRDLGCDVSVLVTHECVLEPGAVRSLVAALEDPQWGVVGPVLTDERTGEVWSSGGWIQPITWLPLNLTDVPQERVTARRWLDGACLAGRSDVLDDPALWDDRYFLYFEDVHLGLALGERGLGVGVVRAARATQSTAGMPVYYASRNRQLLARRFATRRQHARRTVADLLGLAATAVLRPADLEAHWSGLRDGLKGQGGAPA